MLQFIKFVFVGIINTLIDLGILNLLVSIYDIHGVGPAYVGAKAVSFSCAVVNSYIWNKFWVFKESAVSQNNSQEKLSFIAISAVGLLVNVAVSALIFAIGAHADPGLSPRLIGSGAALVGTAAVILSNFFGYKYFVFNQKKIGQKKFISSNA